MEGGKARSILVRVVVGGRLRIVVQNVMSIEWICDEYIAQEWEGH